MTTPNRNDENEYPRLSLVAVYGTLREGYGNHRAVADSRFVGRGTACGFRMYPYAGTGFPAAAVVPDDEERIVVEVYEIDFPTLVRLDMIEGYPNFYDRKSYDVVLDDGSTVRAWIYTLTRAEASRGGKLCAIPTGDWSDVSSPYAWRTGGARWANGRG